MSTLPVIAIALRQATPENPPSSLRLEILLYLCDWYACLTRGSMMTDAQWAFSYSTNPKIQRHQRYVLHSQWNEGKPGPDEQSIIDFVVKQTKGMLFNELFSLAMSTYPLTQKTLYSEMDLVICAQNYHADSLERKAS